MSLICLCNKTASRAEILSRNQELTKSTDDLEKALSEIKSLRGILPICSYCKEIRNDKAYWIRLEKYTQEHSDAEFSHSICEQCLEKYYPEEEDDVDE